MVGGPDAELERSLEQRLRVLRLLRNLPQTKLAEMAGVSTETLRSLESGHGTTVRKLLAVVRALGREEWLNALVADVAATSTMSDVCRTLARQRDCLARFELETSVETMHARCQGKAVRCAAAFFPIRNDNPSMQRPLRPERAEPMRPSRPRAVA